MKRKRQQKQPKGRKKRKKMGKKNQHGYELRGEGEIEIEEKAIDD